jgi:hypothetical protein
VSSTDPVHNIIKISALMPSIKVRIWTWVMLNPFMNNDTDVRITHECLAEHFDTVVWRMCYTLIFLSSINASMTYLGGRE